MNTDLMSLESWLLFDPIIYLLMGTIVLGVFKIIKRLIVRS